MTNTPNPADKLDELINVLRQHFIQAEFLEAKAALQQWRDDEAKKAYWEGIDVMRQSPGADVHPAIQQLIDDEVKKASQQIHLDYATQLELAGKITMQFIKDRLTEPAKTKGDTK